MVANLDLGGFRVFECGDLCVLPAFRKRSRSRQDSSMICATTTPNNGSSFFVWSHRQLKRLSKKLVLSSEKEMVVLIVQVGCHCGWNWTFAVYGRKNLRVCVCVCYRAWEATSSSTGPNFDASALCSTQREVQAFVRQVWDHSVLLLQLCGGNDRVIVRWAPQKAHLLAVQRSPKGNVRLLPAKIQFSWCHWGRGWDAYHDQ